jgi:hypothetical protein
MNRNNASTLIRILLCGDVETNICSCYRPPDSGSNCLDMFNIYFGEAGEQFDKMVISDNFNLQKISWNNNFRTTNANGQPFIEVLNDHFRTQANHFPILAVIVYLMSSHQKTLFSLQIIVSDSTGSTHSSKFEQRVTDTLMIMEKEISMACVPRYRLRTYV